ncbi:transcriptional activator protein acu-15 [Naviculisporaceae sp. PSN 640]
MFATFVSTPAPSTTHSSTTSSSRSPASSITVACPNPGTERSSHTTGSTPAVRPKRVQVARACDWCRVHRIKCDSEQPCNNCRTRGGECSNKGASPIRTLPHAFRELERLRQRIKELEREVEKRDKVISSHQEEVARAYASPGSQGAPVARLSGPQNVELNAWGEPGKASRHIEGIFMSTTQHPQKQWFGPSSQFFFIGRMHSYLAVALRQTHSSQSIQIHVANKPFTNSCVPSPGSTEPGDVSSPNLSMDPGLSPARSLSATQEQYFLDVFWQNHHCGLQIVDEASFKEHYRSLWTPGERFRKPSPLVDIILALSMQQGMPPSLMPQRDRLSAEHSSHDPVKAEIELDARWHYQRCQGLLLSELECPTISTLQCQMFSVIYLCCSSLQNMAHSSLAVAIRTAHILGLHLEPSHELPRRERELRKRIWWSLYTIESKTCMKLGRPWSTTLSEATCTIPADDYELAMQMGCSTSPGDNVTWLTYTVQLVKLVLAARTVYNAFYQKVGLVLSDSGNPNPSLYEDPAAIETCATFLQESMECLGTWKRTVPNTIQNKRKRNGTPMSTDRSPLAIEIFAPVWLQRHRLWLELLYHNLSMNLYRPFICFRYSSDSHAMALTTITHQVVTDTHLLNGWHEAFQWQWNAALTLLGFALAYPAAGEILSQVRTAIDLAIQSCEIFGRDFSVGLSAAAVARDLAKKADIIRDTTRQAGADFEMSAHVDGNLQGSELNQQNLC